MNLSVFRKKSLSLPYSLCQVRQSRTHTSALQLCLEAESWRTGAGWTESSGLCYFTFLLKLMSSWYTEAITPFTLYLMLENFDPSGLNGKSSFYHLLGILKDTGRVPTILGGGGGKFIQLSFDYFSSGLLSLGTGCVSCCFSWSCSVFPRVREWGEGLGLRLRDSRFGLLGPSGLYVHGNQ